MTRSLMLLNLMSKTIFILLVFLMTLVFTLQHAIAFTWTEVDDAGQLPDTAQVITGDGSLELISGFLESPTDVDMYEIYLTVGTIFSVTTVGWTDVNTQLSLFDSSGFGIYSNDDDATDVVQSTLPDRYLPPGLYYLAISDWDYDPVSDQGYIFPSHYPFFHFRTAVEEATDVGGGSPITGWDGLSTTGGGSYTIALTRNTPTPPTPETLTISLDIKPGSYPNSINPKSKGKIPVAILSSSEFFAPAEIDLESLTFGATGDVDSLAFCNPVPEDVNDDGYDDVVCHFYTEKTGFQCGDTEGILKGQTMDEISIAIEGTDSVRIVPSACKNREEGEDSKKK